MITVEEQLAEARRELALRKRLYPQWIKAGTLDADQARHQLAAMEAIVQTLTRMAADQRQLGLFATQEP